MVTNDLSLASVNILRKAFDTSVNALRVKLAPGSKLYPEVANYSLLPSPIGLSGVTYYVLTSTGIWPINRHSAGLYWSDGLVWNYAGDIPTILNASNFKLYDDLNPTKQLAFYLGGITGGATRIITMPDADITLAGQNFANSFSLAQTFSLEMIMAQIGTPSNPTAGHDKLYFKSDDKLYKLTSAGVESEVGGGSSSVLAQRVDLECKFNEAYATAYHEYTYSLGNITGIGIWDTAAKVTKLFTVVIGYTGSNLTSVVITDNITSKTLTKTIAYNFDGSINTLTKAIA